MNPEFINYIKTHKSSIKTQNTYVYEVSRFFKTYDKFNQLNFNDYMASLANNVCASSYNKIGYALQAYVDFLEDSGYKIDNFRGVKSKKVKRQVVPYLTEEEFKKGLSYFEDLFKQHKAQKLRCEVLFYTGLRAYEMANIHRKNIDLEKGTISINITKSSSCRVVKIPTFLISSIDAYFKNVPEKESAFNCTEATIAYICRTYNNMVSPSKRWHPHIFRHGYCRYIFNLTKDIRAVASMMGHSTISTTEQYLRLSNEEALNIVDMAMNKKGRK
jgi:site-specific recombinase XerD